MPQRRGSEHPNIVPYKTFASRDGYVILAIGNDGQFQKWCGFAGAAELAADPRFATNSLRVTHRRELYELMPAYVRAKPTREWVDGLATLGVPCGPVNTLDQVFADPQVQARGMRIDVPHATAAAGTVPLVANPIKMSRTPPGYRHSPPTLGQHTDEVLGELLGMGEAERAALRAAGAIG